MRRNNFLEQRRKKKKKEKKENIHVMYIDMKSNKQTDRAIQLYSYTAIQLYSYTAIEMHTMLTRHAKVDGI